MELKRKVKKFMDGMEKTVNAYARFFLTTNTRM